MVVDDNGKAKLFACCDSCKKVVVYQAHKSGTSGLNMCAVMERLTLLDFRETAKISNALKSKNIDKSIDLLVLTIGHTTRLY